MPKHLDPLVQLQGGQLAASSPLGHAALSASAGTGKTHVLTARVLRLLLAGVEPSSILCLTFTKAGAAEMAERIRARLAHWVRLKDSQLRKELFALDEPNDDAAVDRARTLFANVLDAPGGGLRVQTIHAFAQSLLGGFPAEAGLTPGFRPLEGREQQLLARQTLAELLVQAERGGDAGFVRDLQALSLRLGESGAESFLMYCARAPEALATLGAREGIEPRLRRGFGLPAGDIEAAIAAECDDARFDIDALRRIGISNRRWGSAKGLERAGVCERWLAASAAERAALLAELHSVWARKDGGPRSAARGQAPPDEDYAALAQSAFDCCSRMLAMRRTALMIAVLAAGIRAGQTFAAAYGGAKRAAGVVDFDDLIQSAERLLLMPGMGEWVRYKLDQATDHILVDEAQDTNDSQWNIVRALAAEYFVGEGASSRSRTLFTVGDFKQAIFGFQGTDPRSFEYSREWFKREAAGIDQTFLDLSIDLSFRSSPPILTLVDSLLADLGPDALGLPDPPNPHRSHHADRPGLVTLWHPFSIESEAVLEDDAGEEGWISDSVRLYAAKLARQVRSWVDDPFTLSSRKRPLRPEDILILVRRRSQLAALIVARLHAEGVPVAGVDRLLLSAPLAVQDLLAAMRFAVQPLDDLNLASLLVSPLFGWSQDDLFALAHGRSGPLWSRLRGDESEDRAETLAGLRALLAMADLSTPHQFLERILSGPIDGRRKLLSRLGPEARDPIEELVSSALDYETGASPSLQRFLDWFARGEVEIVRDPSAPLDAVRVMTVHGSKGLQAPLVVLADACSDPDRRGGSVGGGFAKMDLDSETRGIPIFRPRKDELAEPLRSQLEEQDRREREEHFRLLYVALTRAEERLFVGGALGAADRHGPAPASWHAAVERAMRGLGCEWEEDSGWGRSMRLGDAGARATRKTGSAPPVAAAGLPRWLSDAAPIEARPPRPLAPSSIGEDDVADPPPGPMFRAAAERGRLLHQLFERMPAVAAEQRMALADEWLEKAAGVSDAALRDALVADAAAIVGNPNFADIFGPDALAEAPIAAVTPDGSVITGTIDRLLVTDERVSLIDFKTGRSAPASVADIPAAHLRQMAAYVAALEVIFPARTIDAALLYTSGPTLHPLSRMLLEAHMPKAPQDG
ncbi:MAG TPA: double-strand break repair helicase AddA [Allosphingosinicella sp.]|nr:double-strand break repair helicase AddA [Allosphingosinicella sp.]